MKYQNASERKNNNRRFIYVYQCVASNRLHRTHENAEHQSASERDMRTQRLSFVVYQGVAAMRTNQSVYENAHTNDIRLPTVAQFEAFRAQRRLAVRRIVDCIRAGIITMTPWARSVLVRSRLEHTTSVGRQASVRTKEAAR